MKTRENQIEGAFKVGTIVQVSLSDIDRTKLDGTNVTLAIEEKIKGKVKLYQKFRLACEKGQLKNSYAR